MMRHSYGALAAAYDVVSGEWPVYRVGRLLGVPQLRLRPGDTVLDVGCGTGLNFPLLLPLVGPTGLVVGVDASPQMLAVASRKLRRREADNVRLVQADATDLSGSDDQLPQADAILFTYSLSLMRPWRVAWDSARSLARPGARIVVVDMARPTGKAAALTPLARVACWLGGSDIDAHPWQPLAQELTEVSHQEARGGHVQVWAGTVPKP